ncbi:hypothetical protein N9S81_00105, partial [bacterium]|nr:hypothetical protein [bacterium]
REYYKSFEWNSTSKKVFYDNKTGTRPVFNILIAVRILDMCVDLPRCDSVALLQPPISTQPNNKSAHRGIQQLGRAMRKGGHPMAYMYIYSDLENPWLQQFFNTLKRFDPGCKSRVKVRSTNPVTQYSASVVEKEVVELEEIIARYNIDDMHTDGQKYEILRAKVEAYCEQFKDKKPARNSKFEYTLQNIKITIGAYNWWTRVSNGWYLSEEAASAAKGGAIYLPDKLKDLLVKNSSFQPPAQDKERQTQRPLKENLHDLLEFIKTHGRKPRESRDSKSAAADANEKRLAQFLSCTLRRVRKRTNFEPDAETSAMLARLDEYELGRAAIIRRNQLSAVLAISKHTIANRRLPIQGGSNCDSIGLKFRNWKTKGGVKADNLKEALGIVNKVFWKADNNSSGDDVEDDDYFADVADFFDSPGLAKLSDGILQGLREELKKTLKTATDKLDPYNEKRRQKKRMAPDDPAADPATDSASKSTAKKKKAKTATKPTTASKTKTPKPVTTTAPPLAPEAGAASSSGIGQSAFADSSSDDEG